MKIPVNETIHPQIPTTRNPKWFINAQAGIEVDNIADVNGLTKTLPYLLGRISSNFLIERNL